MSIQDPVNQVDMTFKGNDEEGCNVPVPVVFISPALPENIVHELAKLFHVAGHAMKKGIELPACYVQLDQDGNHALLDMDGAPDRRSMSMFGASHAMDHDMIVNIAMGEAWSVPPEVRKELLVADLPDDFKLKDHPTAFECFAVQIETLKGIWHGNIQISPFTGTQGSDDDEGTNGEPRTYVGPLELVKIDHFPDALYPPVLPENMAEMLQQSDSPEAIKGLLGELMQGPLAARKERLEAKTSQAKEAAATASDAIEKASASAK